MIFLFTDELPFLSNLNIFKMNTDFSEKSFDDLYNLTIKTENESYSHDELSDLEDPVFNAELAGTSYEKDVNLSDSNSQVTDLFYWI